MIRRIQYIFFETLVFPIRQYLQIVSNNTGLSLSIPTLEQNLRDNLLRYEQTGVIIAFTSFSVFSLFESFFGTHGSFTHFSVQFLLLSLFTILFLWFVPRFKFSSRYYSLYHLISFFVLYYSHLLFNGAVDFRSTEEKFLIHIIVILMQGIRPGRFPGIPVIIILGLHSLFVIGLSPLAKDDTRYIRLFIFLWVSFAALIIESLLYYKAVENILLAHQQAREKDELLLAHRVHDSLFPNFEENVGMKLFSYRSSTNIAGGDYFDVIPLRDGNTGFFITDVSGHGISSAMMSAAIKVIISLFPYHLKLKPSLLLTTLDEEIHKKYTSHHATAIYIFFDFTSGEARFANAGHPFILYSKQGEPFQEIDSRGSLLGYTLQNPIAEEIIMKIHKGDRFLIYTDGLVEYLSLNGEIAHLQNVLTIMKDIEGYPSEKLLETMIQNIKTKNDFSSFRDDVLLSLIEIK